MRALLLRLSLVLAMRQQPCGMNFPNLESLYWKWLLVERSSCGLHETQAYIMNLVYELRGQPMGGVILSCHC